MIDRQKVFNNAWNGLKAQGFKKSLLPAGEATNNYLAADGACAYRGIGGLKCFVGHNIPDDRYKPVFEGKSVTAASGDVINMLDPALGYPDAEDIMFLRDGQVAHDCSHSPENMKNTLKDFARFYRLEVPE